MINQIREHELQHFLVDYLIGPALNCYYIGHKSGYDVFRLETTTGFYELRLCDNIDEKWNAQPACNDNISPIARLDGSNYAALRGKNAVIFRAAGNSDTSYYFYKQPYANDSV